MKDERKLSDSSINNYNSVIRFIYEVTLDKLLTRDNYQWERRKNSV